MVFPITVRCAHQSFPDASLSLGDEAKVQDLKNSVRDFYSSSPCPTRQRLIYAGHLLRDDVFLREVFERVPVDSADQSRIVHLVYTPNKEVLTKASTPPNASLRRRRDPETPTSAQVPPLVQQPQVTPMATPVMLPGVSPQPEMAALLAAHQQMYQMYLTQYVTYLSQLYGATPPSVLTAAAAPTPAPSTQPQPAQQPNQAAPANNQRPQPDNAGAGVGFELGGGDDPDAPAAPRDWLDMLYMGCRLGLLLMIVGVYTSLERVIFVFVIASTMYAYYNGLFGLRGPAQQQQNEEVQEQPAEEEQVEADRPLDDNNNVAAEEAANAAAAENDDNNNNNPNEPDHSNEQRQQQLTVEQFYAGMTPWEVFRHTCYTFITSFFVSLLPYPPQHEELAM